MHDNTRHNSKRSYANTRTNAKQEPHTCPECGYQQRRQKIFHPKFAVCQMPQEVFKHYKAKGVADDISAVSFYNEYGMVPAVWVEFGDRQDTWVYTFHSPLSHMPMQIRRYYNQNKSAKSIAEVQFCEEDGGPIVEINRGDEIDTWKWTVSEEDSSDGETLKSKHKWQIDDTSDAEDSDDETPDWCVPGDPAPQWYLYRSEEAEATEDPDLELAAVN